MATIRSRGKLVLWGATASCRGLSGFLGPTAPTAALDADTCRAMRGRLFGDPGQVGNTATLNLQLKRFSPPRQRRSGHAGPQHHQDPLGPRFGWWNWHQLLVQQPSMDGQGMMGSAASGIRQPRSDLDGKPDFCVESGTTTSSTCRSHARAGHRRTPPLKFQTAIGPYAAYLATPVVPSPDDRAQLAAKRSGFPRPRSARCSSLW